MTGNGSCWPSAARQTAQAGRARRGPGQVAYRLTIHASTTKRRCGRRWRRLALEAAIQLADETAPSRDLLSPARVRTLRPLNKQKIDAHLKSGRIKAFMSSELLEVDRDTVTLKTASSPRCPTTTCSPSGRRAPQRAAQIDGHSIRRHLGDKAMANPALSARQGDAPTGSCWRSRCFP